MHSRSGFLGRRSSAHRPLGFRTSLAVLFLLMALVQLIGTSAPALATPVDVLDQSQTNTNISDTSPIYSLNSVAQTFTAGITGKLDRVSLNLTRIGSVSADLTVSIYPTTSNKPNTSGTALATGTISAASVPASAGGFGATMVDATFTTPVHVDAGTVYAIVATSLVPTAEDVEGAQINYYGWSVHAPVLGQSDNYAGGNTFQNTNYGGGFAGWTDQNEDQTFATYVIPDPIPSTWHVTDCANDGTDTLRGQIAAAAAGDTIVYDQDCTTTLSSTLMINTNLTIDGSGHGVTLNGAGRRSPAARRASRPRPTAHWAATQSRPPRVTRRRSPSI